MQQIQKEVENRDKQFKQIAKLKSRFFKKQLPVLSIDTKKEEMIGDFYRDGQLYCKKPIEVKEHDFNRFAAGVAIPHGIYSIQKKHPLFEDDFMKTMPVIFNKFLLKWNYKFEY
jgi:hypothetical protein